MTLNESLSFVAGLLPLAANKLQESTLSLLNNLLFFETIH